MKTGMKWFLGILLGVVIVAVLAGVGYMIFNHWHGNGWMMSDRYSRSLENDRFRSWQNMPGQGSPQNLKPGSGRTVSPVWGLPNSRFGVLRPLPMLFCCFIALGIVFLLVLGVIYLAGGLRRNHQPAVAPAQTTPPAAVQPVSSTLTTTAKTCPHCGQPVQEEWKHCPSCGAPLDEKAENIEPTV